MNQTEPTRRTPLRGDVQGLRAVAVLAVIASHAGVSVLAGGFVGVDVFFVISGFLITQLIIGGIARDGGFSLSDFYARRARRILPVASVVLAVTVVASVLLLGVIDALDAARDAVWSAFFAANVRFATQGVDYFAQEATTSPFQHYWSLAVEEQFYVVWPLLVVGVLWWHRRRGGDGVPLRALALTLLTVVVASLAWSVHQTGAQPESAYFSTFTRAWELALGALVALMVHARRRSTETVGRLQVELLAWTGMVAMAFSMVTYRESMGFPGTAALLPVLGAASFLAAGSTEVGRRSSLARLLGVAPLRALGDWSFSLYLWHWPLLVLPRVRLGRDLTPVETVAAVAATVALSYLSHRYVETPFRVRRTWRAPRRSLLLYPASLALVLPVAVAGQAWSDYRGSERGDNPAITISAGQAGEQQGPAESGEPADLTLPLLRASAQAARDDQAIPSDLTPDLLDLDDDVADVGACDYGPQIDAGLCRRGDPDADRVLVITGDSHARVWIPALEQIARESGWAAYYFVKPQCTASLVAPARVSTGDPWPECTDFHAWVEEQVAALEPDLMLVSTSPPGNGVYDDDGEHVTDEDEVAADLDRGFDELFRTYRRLADEVVLISDVPRLSEDPGECLGRPGATLGDCLLTPDPTTAALAERSAAVAERRGVAVVDPTPWLCVRGECPTVVGSTITYRDRGHLTSTRAAELWRPLGRALDLL